MSWIRRNKWYLGGAIAIALLGVGFVVLRKTKGGKGGRLFGGGLKADEWSSQKDFWNVSGTRLDTIGKSVGITMSRNKGLGSSFSETAYLQLKNKPTISWAVYDISKDSLIGKSENASKGVYGASVSKVVVSANAYDKNKGELRSDADIGKVIKLLVKSDNGVWDAVTEMGGGNDSVNDFSNRMGYGMSPARRKGNSISATGMVKFWRDVCRNKFDGAESIFKITSSCQTSSSRSRKCIPTNCYMGGKTGTYDRYNHDTAWIQKGDKWYAICVLTSGNDGSDAVATMFGGLFKEFCK